MTKTCPICGEEKNARGFAWHLKACKAKAKLDPIKKRYAFQLQNMTAEAAERFLRKA